MLNTHRDAFVLLLQDIAGKRRGFVRWQFLELFSGQLHQAQKHPSFTGMLMSAEEYCLLFPAFTLYPTWRKSWYQQRIKCQGQGFRLIDCIERSSRDSPCPPEAIPHLFLTLSSSPEAPASSSTVASHRLSCFPRSWTLLPALLFSPATSSHLVPHSASPQQQSPTRNSVLQFENNCIKRPHPGLQDRGKGQKWAVKQLKSISSRVHFAQV